jgi:hypothetical protein
MGTVISREARLPITFGKRMKTGPRSQYIASECRGLPLTAIENCGRGRSLLYLQPIYSNVSTLGRKLLAYARLSLGTGPHRM